MKFDRELIGFAFQKSNLDFSRFLNYMIEKIYQNRKNKYKTKN